MDERIKPEQLWEVLNRAADNAEQAGRHEECLGLLQQSTRMAELAFGDNHRDYAFTLIRLADTCLDLNKLDDAEAHYSQAIPILRASLGETHLSVGISLRNLAELYEKQGKSSQAESTRVLAARILRSNQS